MALDYANERYVLLYTRDTATWKLLDWEARAVLMFLLRKVDRAGVLDVGEDGIDGLAAVIEVPVEVVARAMPKLVARQTVAESGTAYVVPNFMDAQEAPRSDKQRQRDSREKRRALALSRNVTVGHEMGPNVTIGHTASQPVTPIRSGLVRSGPDLSLSTTREADQPTPGPAGSFAPAARYVALVVELLNAARREIDPTAQPVDADQGDEMALMGHLRSLPEDKREAAIRHGVAVIAASVKAGKDAIGILRPGELVGPRSWRKWQAATVESIRAPPRPRFANDRAPPPLPAVGKGPAPIRVDASERAMAAEMLGDSLKKLGIQP